MDVGTGRGREVPVPLPVATAQRVFALGGVAGDVSLVSGSLFCLSASHVLR